MKIYDFEGQKNISGDRIHQVRATKRISQADLWRDKFFEKFGQDI